MSNVQRDPWCGSAGTWKIGLCAFHSLLDRGLEPVDVVRHDLPHNALDQRSDRGDLQLVLDLAGEAGAGPLRFEAPEAAILGEITLHLPEAARALAVVPEV